MQIKNHIAIFLAFLLISRMFSFDAQLLALATEPGELAVIEHSCKMKNFPAAASEAHQFGESTSGAQISYSAICNSFFQFEVPDPVKEIAFTHFHEFMDPVMLLHSAEKRTTSPPPKVAV